MTEVPGAGAAIPSDTLNADDEVAVARYSEMTHDFKIFMEGVLGYLGEHPTLRAHGKEIVHSYKSRLKDPDHLRAKLARKRAAGRPIPPERLFEQVTDLAGVRIIHLFQEHFSQIDGVIRRKVETGDWVLGEKPTAYTWDPEAAEFLESLNLMLHKSQPLTRAFII